MCVAVAVFVFRIPGYDVSGTVGRHMRLLSLFGERLVAYGANKAYSMRGLIRQLNMHVVLRAIALSSCEAFT